MEITHKNHTYSLLWWKCNDDTHYFTKGDLNKFLKLKKLYKKGELVKVSNHKEYNYIEEMGDIGNFLFITFARREKVKLPKITKEELSIFYE